MKKRILALIHGARVFLGNALEDAETQAHLASKKVPVGRLREGKAMLDGLLALIERRNERRSWQMGMTEAVERLFRELVLGVTQYAYGARRALRKRPDLLAKVATNRTVKVEEGPSPPSAEQAPRRRPKRYDRWRTLSIFVGEARTILANSIGDSEVLTEVDPLGYSKESLEEMVAEIDELARLDREQQAAIGATQGATAQIHEEAERFRAWYTPWRRRVLGVVRDRPDLASKLTVR